MKKQILAALSLACGVALTLATSLSFGQTEGEVAAEEKGAQTENAVQEAPKGDPKETSAFKATNYHLDTDDLEADKLPDGWRASSGAVAAAKQNDATVILFPQEKLSETTLSGLFEQPGCFRFAFTVDVPKGYRYEHLQVVLIDEKGVELPTTIRSSYSDHIMAQLADAEEFEIRPSAKRSEDSQERENRNSSSAITFILERTNAEKGTFVLTADGFDGLSPARRAQFGTLVGARFITSADFAISDVFVEGKKSDAFRKREDLKERYVLEVEDAELGDQPEGWEGSDAMLVAKFGNIKVLRPTSSGRPIEYAKSPDLHVKGNFALSFTLISHSHDRYSNVSLNLMNETGKHLILPVMVSGTHFTYGLEKDLIEANCKPFGIASFTLTRRGDVFTLVLSGNETNPITIKASGFGELSSVSFESNSNQVGLSRLQVVKLKN